MDSQSTAGFQKEQPQSEVTTAEIYFTIFVAEHPQIISASYVR